jgi:hypothetical protein
MKQALHPCLSARKRTGAQSPTRGVHSPAGFTLVSAKKRSATVSSLAERLISTRPRCAGDWIDKEIYARALPDKIKLAVLRPLSGYCEV